MVAASLTAVLRRHEQTEADDTQLLARFLTERDADAFAALVRRHGAMVLGVCRRVLGREHDAEDAYQAAFLVLARKAASVRNHASLGPWLHGVAFRVASKARTAAQRRQRHERRAADRRPTVCTMEDAWRDLQAVLDAEVERLPSPLRTVLVLCCLEGVTHVVAARRLGLPVGTVKTRLARAREVLRTRLAARGLDLPAAILGTVLAINAADAAMPAASVAEVLRTAMAPTTAPVGVVALAAEAGRAGWFLTLLAMGMVLAGTVLAFAGRGSDEADPALERPPANAAAPAVDLLGDPLPEGAIARLGSTRLRTARYRHFTPDGRRILLDRADGGLQFFDVPSGKPGAIVRATDVPERKDIVGSTLDVSPDGKLLAAVCWKGRCGIWDAETGRLVRWLESGPFYSILRCRFSPDGKHLAVGSGVAGGNIDGITVGVYRVDTGQRLFAAPGTNAAFASDGQSLLTWEGYIGGRRQTSRRVALPTGAVLSEFTHALEWSDLASPTDGVHFFETQTGGAVRIWDVATGEIRHHLRRAGGGAEDRIRVRHAPGRRELIGVRVQAPVVWCWDRETGQELWHLALTAPAYYPELSRDGRTLALDDSAKGTVRLLDAATGKERLTLQPRVIGHEPRVNLTADGQTIATSSGGIFSQAVAFWDATTGRRLSDLPGHAAGITAVAFARDGKTVHTSGADRMLRTWDTTTGRELRRAETARATYLAASPDRARLFAGATDGSVRVLDARTGVEERRFTAFRHRLAGLDLTADGSRLVAVGRDAEAEASTVRLLDTGTGKVAGEYGATSAQAELLAVRPDGGAAVTAHAGRRVVLWEGGKQTAAVVGRGTRVSATEGGRAGFQTPFRIGSIALSPDGRRLAYSDQEEGIVLLDAATGREIGRFKPDVYYQNPSAREELRDALAFSPDGATLAWSGVESTKDVFLIEARTVRLRTRLVGDSGPIGLLAFAPDGSRLLSAGPDGSALLWGLEAPRRALSPAEVEACWADLATDDAPRAYRAVGRLAASPTEAVAYLGSRLRPVAAPAAGEVERFVADLGAEAFTRREAALAGLVDLGPIAEAALRRALEGKPGLEAKRRLEHLLEALSKPDPAGETLRRSRAVEVLGRVGTAEAREVLRRLAGGAADARLTREAKATLAWRERHG